MLVTCIISGRSKLTYTLLASFFELVSMNKKLLPIGGKEVAPDLFVQLLDFVALLKLDILPPRFYHYNKFSTEVKHNLQCLNF